MSKSLIEIVKEFLFEGDEFLFDRDLVQIGNYMSKSEFEYAKDFGIRTKEKYRKKYGDFSYGYLLDYFLGCAIGEIEGKKPLQDNNLDSMDKPIECLKNSLKLKERFAEAHYSLGEAYRVKAMILLTKLEDTK